MRLDGLVVKKIGPAIEQHALFHRSVAQEFVKNKPKQYAFFNLSVGFSFTKFNIFKNHLLSQQSFTAPVFEFIRIGLGLSNDLYRLLRMSLIVVKDSL
jgi:hypothetical protein